MKLQIFLKKLGKKVMQIRKSRGLTQKEAARRAQISYRYFQKIESGGANITMDTLFRLVELLNVHVCDLLPERADLVEEQLLPMEV